MRQSCLSFGCVKAKKLSDLGSLPLLPAGSKPPDHYYRLTLSARQILHKTNPTSKILAQVSQWSLRVVITTITRAITRRCGTGRPTAIIIMSLRDTGRLRSRLGVRWFTILTRVVRAAVNTFETDDVERHAALLHHNTHSPALHTHTG